ncbi:hypothetical protein TWF696_001325 [Orbilia brochopaga]|uniref:Uncharacterized protein n=1 Tax=Orbilia brochopaga TaxID=3140254 RepID=A0AAV9U934_9PEZI
MATHNDPSSSRNGYGTIDNDYLKSATVFEANIDADTESTSISSESVQYSTSSLLNEDEEPRLLNVQKAPSDRATTDNHASSAKIIAVLLLGVFVANGDGSFVLATNGVISSEFGRLDDASGLVTGYMLSMCALQPLVHPYFWHMHVYPSRKIRLRSD